ncbi:MAG TPA: glycosyltransferase, partial [Rhizomicrobium sp.]|nr:glycosyltransferase [Rhizomicrobium sp.]
MTASILFGFLPLLIWLYLLLGRRGFWLMRERDTLPIREPEHWPSVVAVVPARNEEDAIKENLTSLLAQDYPGELRVILVDDQSEDRTADIANAIQDARLTVLRGDPRAAGWTGKLWAMSQGVRQAG